MENSVLLPWSVLIMLGSGANDQDSNSSPSTCDENLSKVLSLPKPQSSHL